MLSVCVITKNESHCIAQMIQSVLGFATEIVIADTGSTDTTPAIARNLGARVVDIPWTDDFSEARNRSLELATQPWILVLDADEELDPSAHTTIQQLIRGKPQGVSLLRDHYTPDLPPLTRPLPLGHAATARGGVGIYQTSDLRLFPNDKRLRFEGAVHETIEDSLVRAGFDHLRSTLLIHHFGPIYAAERQHEKSALYTALALKKVLLHGDDWRAHFHYAVELQNLSHHQDAIASFQKSIGQYRGHCPTWRQLAISQIELGQYESALDSLREALELNSTDQLAWNSLGICFLRLKNIEHATFCFETILKSDPENTIAKRLLSAIAAEREFR